MRSRHKRHLVFSGDNEGSQVAAVTLRYCSSPPLDCNSLGLCMLSNYQRWHVHRMLESSVVSIQRKEQHGLDRTSCFHHRRVVKSSLAACDGGVHGNEIGVLRPAAGGQTTHPHYISWMHKAITRHIVHMLYHR